MRCVVDTNILFSFFWKDSFTRQILVSPSNEFFSSELALKELIKYFPLISSKTGLSKKEFSYELNKLKTVVRFFPREHYKNFIRDAEKISPDKDDSDFFSLCLKLNLPLWSNDRLLKKQDRVAVLNTEELIDVLVG